MDHQRAYTRSSSSRVQWGSYGFIAGILLGVMIGWFFSGIVGAFVRLAMAAVIVIPLILLFIAWRKVVSPWLRPPGDQTYTAPFGAIETRGVVHEPRTR